MVVINLRTASNDSQFYYLIYFNYLFWELIGIYTYLLSIYMSGSSIDTIEIFGTKKGEIYYKTLKGDY